MIQAGNWTLLATARKGAPAIDHSDVFVAKVDPEGSVVWVVVGGGQGKEVALCNALPPLPA